MLVWLSLLPALSIMGLSFFVGYVVSRELAVSQGRLVGGYERSGRRIQKQRIINLTVFVVAAALRVHAHRARASRPATADSSVVFYRLENLQEFDQEECLPRCEVDGKLLAIHRVVVVRTIEVVDNLLYGIRGVVVEIRSVVCQSS